MLAFSFFLHGILLCFHRAAPVTFQALTEADRKLWMEAMDGKEPVSFALLSAYDGTFCTWTRFCSEFYRTSLVCPSRAVREWRVLTALISAMNHHRIKRLVFWAEEAKLCLWNWRYGGRMRHHSNQWTPAVAANTPTPVWVLLLCDSLLCTCLYFYGRKQSWT